MLERHLQEIVSARRALNGAAGRAPDAPPGKVGAPPRPPPKLDFKDRRADVGDSRARPRPGSAPADRLLLGFSNFLLSGLPVAAPHVQWRRQLGSPSIRS